MSGDEVLDLEQEVGSMIPFESCTGLARAFIRLYGRLSLLGEAWCLSSTISVTFYDMKLIALGEKSKSRPVIIDIIIY